jgi:hypothetical protein
MQAEDGKTSRLGQDMERASPLERRAGAFLDQAKDTVGLADADVVAIERRLLQRGPRVLRLRLWPAFVVVVVVLIASSVMALVGGWRPRLPFVGAISTESSSAREARRTKVPRATGRALPEPGVQPVLAPPPTASVSEPRPPVPMRRAPRQEPPLPSPQPSSVGVPEESPVSAEARSLAQALSLWRREKNGDAALSLLDAHERRFSHGALSVESKIARAEILLALTRRDHALRVLDSLGLAGLPRARELETLRGELRAEAGRCRDARADLSRVLEGTRDDDLSRRAQTALARCP